MGSCVSLPNKTVIVPTPVALEDIFEPRPEIKSEPKPTASLDDSLDLITLDMLSSIIFWIITVMVFFYMFVLNG
jgi:hypothetical protein